MALNIAIINNGTDRNSHVDNVVKQENKNYIKQKSFLKPKIKRKRKKEHEGIELYFQEQLINCNG